jgi:hypothetical protein
MQLLRPRQHAKEPPDQSAIEAAFEPAEERTRAWTGAFFGVAAMLVATLVVELARRGSAPMGVVLFLAISAGAASGATATGVWTARTLANLRLNVISRLRSR